ncbi:MAG: hypothetical protein K8M05_33725 [Deltaproteobacteria bacterium]|nr:hypothetical protein [Kofleriaceae bacterium]
MLTAAFVALVIVQGLAMAFDEAWFHRRRGLPRWERIGHPIDTLTVVACFAWLVAASPSATALGVFVALALASCLVITKDEWIHARCCRPGEHWLHALLFVLHPLVLGAGAAVWWRDGQAAVLGVQLVVVAVFGTYQLVYWNLVAAPTTPAGPARTRRPADPRRRRSGSRPVRRRGRTRRVRRRR